MEDSVNIGLICDEVVPRIPDGHTHLLIEVRSKNYAILYRLSDGMYQGEISDKMALFGENPNKRESRLFCSYGHGLRFVKDIAAKDQTNPPTKETLDRAEADRTFIPPMFNKPVIFEYDYDSAHQILMPGNVDLGLAVNGSRTKLPTTRKIN